MKTTILEDVISSDLRPVRKGGVTLYPASRLAQVFNWTAEQGRTAEWVEGFFYRPDDDQGQMTGLYIRQRRELAPHAFRTLCVALSADLDADAGMLGMKGYFEIGVSVA